MGLGFFYYSWLYCFHVQRFERANDGIVQNIRKYFWLCFFSSLSLVCLCTIYNGIHILGWSGITFSGCELKYGENELKNLSFCLCLSFALSFTLCVSVSVCLPFQCVKSVRSVCIDTMVIPITLIVYGIETNFHMHTKTF